MSKEVKLEVHPMDRVQYSYNDLSLIGALTYILRKEPEWGVGRSIEFNFFKGKNNPQLIVDFDTQEFQMVNWMDMDTTWYALVGLAHLRGYTMQDYYRED